MRFLLVSVSFLVLNPHLACALPASGKVALTPLQDNKERPFKSSSVTATSRIATAAARGVSFLKAKQFKEAELCLKQAVEANPSDAYNYYYLANAYVHLKQHEQAIECYRRSYELDPFSTVSGFCRQALLSYNVAIPVADKQLQKPKGISLYKEGSPQNKPWQSSSSSRKTASGSSELSSENDPAQPKLPEQTANQRHLNNASAMIQRQAAEEKARKKQFADHLAGNVNSTGLAKANKIRADAEEQIKELYEGPVLYDTQGNARGRGVPSWHLNPTLQGYLKERADQIRRDAEERAQLELSVSNDRSKQYQKWSSDRQEDLDHVTDSLESQMRSTGPRSGVSLNPVGTGLYVRNYSTFKPKNPIPDAHSSVVRMIDRGYEDPENKSETKGSPQHSNQVSGRLTGQ